MKISSEHVSNSLRVRQFFWGFLFTLIVMFTSLYPESQASIPGSEKIKTVVLPERPELIEQLAAEEFAKYYTQMTGLIKKDGRFNWESGEAEVHIGKTALVEKLINTGNIQLDTEMLGLDGFIIKSIRQDDNNALILCGISPKGTLNAVYHYLENYCDVGFFMDGDYVPKHTGIPIEDIDITEKPAFSDRHYQLAFGGAGLDKYQSSFYSEQLWKQRLSWLAKKRFNLTEIYMWIMSPMATGVVDEVFNIERQWVDYPAPWPSTWTWPPQYRTELLKNVFQFGRQRGIRWIYVTAIGEVPHEWAQQNPDEYIIPSSYGVAYLHPSNPKAVELSKKYYKHLIEVFGTDHLYRETPYNEEGGGGNTLEEKFQVKLLASQKLTEVLYDVDPNYIWVNWTWDFQVNRTVFTDDNLKTYFHALPKEHMYIYETNTDMADTPFYKVANYFYGIKWAPGILHSFQGDDHLHGNMDKVISVIQQAAEDSHKCSGIFNCPESTGHNIFMVQLFADLSWDPNNINKEEFIHKYVRTRYGSDCENILVPAWEKLVEVFFSDKPGSGDTKPVYKVIGYWHNGAIPVLITDRVPAKMEKAKEIAARIKTTKEALDIMMTARSQQMYNNLYVNDMVDITKAYLALLNDYHFGRLYEAYQLKDKTKFKDEMHRVKVTLYEIARVLSTCPDRSLKRQISEVMSVPGTNPFTPRIIRRHCSVNHYAVNDVFEQVTNFYIPLVDAYIEYLWRDMNGTPDPNEELIRRFKEIHDRWENEPIAVDGRYFSDVDTLGTVFNTLRRINYEETGMIPDYSRPEIRYMYPTYRAPVSLK